jgi:hypothetical protein
MAEFTLIECNIKCVGLEIKTKLTRLGEALRGFDHSEAET